MTRRPALPALLLSVVCAVTGCSSQTETYCGTLKEERPALTELADDAAAPGGDIFADSLPVFERLRSDAPDDLSDEWDTFVFAWQGLADAFGRAEVSPGEYRPGQTPGVSPAEDDAIADAAAELRSVRVVDAGDAIEQHARDVCKVDLGLSSGG